MNLQEQVIDTFNARFGTPPAFIARAPGRVNLIGEHTDYNDGFVLPMAIDRAVWIALRPNNGRQVNLYSLNFAAAASFSLDNLENCNAGWIEYVKGTAWALQEAGLALQGWDGVVAGDVPVGAGLSSSAALELATARAFAAVSGWAWHPAQMAKVTQRAENDWVGVNCGIMDQMISAAGKAGHALLIDTRTLQLETVPLPPTAVVVLDTATRRGLADSEYNTRRTQCEAAANYFGVPALRDVSLAQFQAQAAGLDEVTRRRARHVVSENARVLQAVAAMRLGDTVRLGQLINASHASLRDDFEVSSAELDLMVDIARQQPGCFGARMTGAGFGGCAVALVQTAVVDTFVTAVATAYQQTTQLQPQIYVCQATNGAEIQNV